VATSGNADSDVKLKRSLSLSLLTLYGLGTMVGAGIYVLLGEAAGRAGMHTPIAFLLAALVVAPTALSFGELSARFPKSAGEALYVRVGLDSSLLALIVGLLVVMAGTVSAASIVVGSVGYIQSLVAIPSMAVIFLVVILLGGLAAWGITQSVLVAAILALVEIGGLLAVVIAGAPNVLDDPDFLSTAFLVGEMPAWNGILAASILAFYAFIGFEDMVNVAEEVKKPERNLPLSILLALLLTTFLYVSVATVAIATVPPDLLAASKTPLALVFSTTTGWPIQILSLIGAVAAINGILIQIVMAPRVLYGLSRQHALPVFLGKVHPKTRTPLYATLIITGLVLTLALVFPIDKLARWTALTALIIFTLCNLALIRIKVTQPEPPATLSLPLIVPILGLISSLGFLLVDVMRGLID